MRCYQSTLKVAPANINFVCAQRSAWSIRKGVELIAPTSLMARRDIAFNESELLAKESEEALFYRDMQSDLVRQIVNRLQGIKLSAS